MIQLIFDKNYFMSQALPVEFHGQEQVKILGQMEQNLNHQTNITKQDQTNHINTAQLIHEPILKLDQQTKPFSQENQVYIPEKQQEIQPSALVKNTEEKISPQIDKMQLIEAKQPHFESQIQAQQKFGQKKSQSQKVQQTSNQFLLQNAEQNILDQKINDKEQIIIIDQEQHFELKTPQIIQESSENPHQKDQKLPQVIKKSEEHAETNDKQPQVLMKQQNTVPITNETNNLNFPPKEEHEKVSLSQQNVKSDKDELEKIIKVENSHQLTHQKRQIQTLHHLQQNQLKLNESNEEHKNQESKILFKVQKKYQEDIVVGQDKGFVQNFSGQLQLNKGEQKQDQSHEKVQGHHSISTQKQQIEHPTNQKVEQPSKQQIVTPTNEQNNISPHDLQLKNELHTPQQKYQQNNLQIQHSQEHVNNHQRDLNNEQKNEIAIKLSLYQHQGPQQDNIKIAEHIKQQVLSKQVNLGQHSQYTEKREQNQFKTISCEQGYYQNQKYRLNSQNVQSIAEDGKEKEKAFVEFIQFPQTEQNHLSKKQDNLIIDSVKKQNQVVLNTKLEIKQQKKSTKQLMNQIKQQKSPRKEGVGKIAKRTLHDKKVYDVMVDLQKNDQKKILLPKLQAKRSSKKKMDLSKLDSHISIQTNVLNVTIGQILSKDQTKVAEILLDEIDELKKKLMQLENKKKAGYQSPQRGNDQDDNPLPFRDTISSAKSTKKMLMGKIYRKFDQNNSKISEELQSSNFVEQKRTSTRLIQPTAISSAPRQRFASTHGGQGFKNTKQQEPDHGRTMPISFRVKKNNKSFAVSEFDSKQIGFISGREREKFEEDKCFQAKVQRQQKIQFLPEEKLDLIEKPAERNLTFQNYFRQYVQRFFIDIGLQYPKRQWIQQELVDLAKNTFKKFGFNIHSEKHVTLSVKKYKNCVSFILDNQRTILWYYEGKFYFGGWTINHAGEGEKNGWGYDYVPSKFMYSGSFKENKRDGYGIMKFLNKQKDTIYEGYWKNGTKHGFGKQIEPDQVQYIGQWSQGKKHGKGAIKLSQTQSFDGNFYNGLKSGVGKQVFKNGDIYEGLYSEGKFDGKGVYKWANDSRYEGQFKSGVRNGHGIWIANYRDIDSDSYQGQYVNDKKNGYGLYKWKDGTVYEGEFLNDLKHGEGCVSYGDGKTVKLQWFEGNVVPKQQPSQKSNDGVKKGSSRISSQKSELSKNSVTKNQIKFNNQNVESKIKPTRISLGIQKI